MPSGRTKRRKKTAEEQTILRVELVSIPAPDRELRLARAYGLILRATTALNEPPQDNSTLERDSDDESNKPSS